MTLKWRQATTKTEGGGILSSYLSRLEQNSQWSRCGWSNERYFETELTLWQVLCSNDMAPRMRPQAYQDGPQNFILLSHVRAGIFSALLLIEISHYDRNVTFRKTFLDCFKCLPESLLLLCIESLRWCVTRHNLNVPPSLTGCSSILDRKVVVNI